MLRSFSRSRSGATAMLFALSVIPVLGSIGAAVDYSRQSNSSAHAQQVLDSALLAAVSSSAEGEDALEAEVDRFLNANLDTEVVRNHDLVDVHFDEEADRLTARLTGNTPTTIMSMVGIDSLGVDVASSVLRGIAGSLEVALVLDNTWSMSESDSSGKTKISALKTAANLLVTEVTKDKTADVKIGVVPYADYVNVGTANRNAAWLSVPTDSSTTSEKVCTTSTTKTTCTKKTCTTYTDGVASTSQCNDVCTTTTVEPYQTCSGGGTTTKKWYGCVMSRKTGTLRLNDSSPSTPYPGISATSQTCLNPIIPLTDNVKTVTDAINGLIINIGGYKPATYIPAGLIWGVNVLSPTAPFTEGAAYDTNNKFPRKAIVLMTDGENTRRFNSSDGSHASMSSNTTTAANQLKATNDDTVAICDYAKAQKIEVYVVALMVDDTTAQAMLDKCASSSDTFYNTASSTQLAAAFQDIAASLKEIRVER